VTVAVSLAFAVPSVRAEPVAVLDGLPIEVQAERLEIDLRGGAAVLTGDVHMRRGDMHVRCDRVEAKYDQVPSVTWARATGAVQARVGDLLAKAREAQLNWLERSIALRGDVRFSRSGAWLTAREARIDLRSRKVSLEQVRGAFPIPSALPGVP
jgi:lipopolysaccharide transport protein LptA